MQWLAPLAMPIPRLAARHVRKTGSNHVYRAKLQKRADEAHDEYFDALANAQCALAGLVSRFHRFSKDRTEHSLVGCDDLAKHTGFIGPWNGRSTKN